MKVKNIADGLKRLDSLKNDKTSLEGFLNFIDDKHRKLVEKESLPPKFAKGGYVLTLGGSCGSFQTADPLNVSDSVFSMIYMDLRSSLVSSINKLTVDIDSLEL